MPSNTITFTRDDVQSILAREGSEQAAAVEEFHKVAVRTFKSGTAQAEKSLGKATLAAALDTYLAERTDRLVPKGVRKGAGVPGDTGKQWGERYGVGDSTVTLWRTLGHSVAAVGIDPEEEDTTDEMSTWRLLAFKGAATNKVVAEAVYADDATPESVREAVLTIREPNGKVKRAENGSGTSRAGNAQANAGLTLAEMVSTNPVEAAIEALKIVRDACKAIQHEDSEGWSKVEDSMRSILDTETAARVKSAAERRAAANSNRSGRSRQTA